MADEEKAALRARVRALLPQNVVGLMDEVEAFAAQHITIERNTLPVSPTDPFPNAPALLLNHDKASILLRDLEAIDPQGILHELLHAKRYWVDAVAQLRPSEENNNEQNRHITADLENTLEHLVIVPREGEYGFDPHGHWNGISKTVWDKYPWPEMTEAAVRRRRCFTGWLTAALTSDAELLERIENCLAQEGLLVEARRLLERVRPFMAVAEQKPRALATVARFLPISPHALRIVYFDITNRTRRYEAMAHR